MATIFWRPRTADNGDWNAAEDLKAVLDILQEGSAKGLILDLRCKRGGLLASLADVSELFLHKADVITSIRSRPFFPVADRHMRDYRRGTAPEAVLMRRCLPLLLALFCPSLCAAAAPQADEKPSEKTVAEFADQLLEAAAAISDRYFVEIPQGQLIEWAVRGLYRRCFSADAPPEIDERLQKANSMKPEELRSLLIDVRKDVQHSKLLGEQYFVEDTSDDRYFDLALEEMCRRLDGETRVVYGGQSFHVQTQRVVAHLGLRLRSDPSTGFIEIVTPFLDGPAYKAGLRAGDLIGGITVFNEPSGEELKEPRVVSTRGLSSAAALRLLEGTSRTKVQLLVRRPGEEKEKEYNLIRKWATEEVIFGRRRQADDHWDYWIDADKKLAYIRIGSFISRDWGDWDAAEDLKAALNSLQRGNIKGLVLDLRFDKGGLLSSEVDVSEFFLHKNDVITSIRSRGRDLEDIRSTQDGLGLKCPVVCLVNSETARAAEVFAACLQDHKRTVVMGERTSGQCGIQNVAVLHEEKMFLHITTASFFSPGGRKLYKEPIPGCDDDEWGVVPDAKYVLKLPADERRDLAEYLDRQTYILPADQYGKKDATPFKDRQLEMALAYLRSQGEKP